MLPHFDVTYYNSDNEEEREYARLTEEEYIQMLNGEEQ